MIPFSTCRQSVYSDGMPGTTTTTTPKIVEVDQRGRLSVGKLVDPGQFVATVGSDGSLLLEPAIVTTALEASLRANEDLYRQVREGLDHPDQAQPVTAERRRRGPAAG